LLDKELQMRQGWYFGGGVHDDWHICGVGQGDDGGQIRRFTIETETDVEGQVRAITLVELQGKMSRAVIRALHRIPEVTTVFATNGNWDLVAEIRAETLGEFDRALRDIREIPGVLNSESCLLLAPVAG